MMIKHMQHIIILFLFVTYFQPIHASNSNIEDTLECLDSCSIANSFNSCITPLHHLSLSFRVITIIIFGIYPSSSFCPFDSIILSNLSTKNSTKLVLAVLGAAVIAKFLVCITFKFCITALNSYYFFC